MAIARGLQTQAIALETQPAVALKYSAVPLAGQVLKVDYVHEKSLHIIIFQNIYIFIFFSLYAKLKTKKNFF